MMKFKTYPHVTRQQKLHKFGLIMHRLQVPTSKKKKKKNVCTVKLFSSGMVHTKCTTLMDLQ